MKKTLLKTTILAIILVAAILGTTVNAGSVTAPATIKAGATFTVKINVDTAMTNADATVTYDATKLEYVKESATAGSLLITENAETAGEIVLSMAGGTKTTKTVELTFKAKEDIKGNAAVEVTSFAANTNETLANTSVTIKAAEEAKDPVKDPDKDPVKDPDKKPTTPNGDKVGTDGKPITKLPQTGAPVFAGAIALVVLTAGAIVLVKRAK